MSTLGLIAVAIAAVIVGLVLLRRGRPAAKDRPKTVADLVKLRAESTEAAVPAAVGAGTTGRDAPVAGSATVLPVMNMIPPIAAPNVPPPVAPPTGDTGSAAAPGAVAPPEPPAPAVDVPHQARSTAEPSTGLVPTVDDTPWGRAARMVSGGGEPGAWRAPESVEIVPLRLLSPQTPTDRSSGPRSQDWAGWADWADVDAEEDARAEPAQPMPDPRFGAAAAGTDSRREPSGRANGADSAAEAAGSPAVEAAGSPAAESSAAGPAPAESSESSVSERSAESFGAGSADAESSAAGSAAAEPSVGGAAGPSAAVPGTARSSRPDSIAESSPSTAGSVVAGLTTADPADRSTAEPPRSPVPPTSVNPAERPAGESASPGVDRTVTSRSRQSADERAAEQAAADLALLRTFGYADPSLRPDSAPVVSLMSQQDPSPEPVPGAEQPVRFRAMRRGGVPAEGVAVMLLDDKGRTVAEDKAGPDGRGEVRAPAPGGYVLVCTARGHQPGAAAITVADAPIEADVLLVRSASLYGSVHGEDGPIAGARVTLVQDGEIVDSADTDEDGSYRIGDIAAGEYGLSVVAAGCEPIAVLLEVPDEADLRHDVEMEPAGVQAAYSPDDDEFPIGQL
ncbi:carboxypeptidase regulatory-like domain-containing protein [Pseudonocardia alaniniphila]|uniref:Carboxypeptidase regulatory-like domain-containing protein n=1 Tax=Pseudonocardia alaniniphila TaxID=75291 RepID=A0ABS9TH29_9PSEU|nr:carboxypeptidase regulatory-like domain-containing protein [Pseudonocardia alaniniphila]MCH6167839.1 carboxypeptidase regulatory-like domain-containing protein [Pseudonocardia alaniniphila]